MIVYELITLSPPFEDVNPLQLSMKIIQGTRTRCFAFVCAKALLDSTLGKVPELPDTLPADMKHLANLYER